MKANGDEMKVSHEPPDIENLMKLNPRIKPFTNAVPSAVTKKVTFVLHKEIHEKQNLEIFYSQQQCRI